MPITPGQACIRAVRLLGTDGLGLPANHTFAASDTLLSVNGAAMANTTNAYTTIATITIPRSGVYTVRAFVWGVNTAAGCDPQYRINGSAQLTVTTGPTGKALVLEKEHTLTSTQAVDVQARANGSDTTTAHGSISITPIRLS